MLRPQVYRFVAGMATLFLMASGLSAALTITTGSNLGTNSLGQAYVPLNATGGSGSYTWSVASGTLPTGMNIASVPGSSPAQPGLVGVASAAGNYAFSLTVNDGITTATQAFTWKITALTTKDINLPDAFVSTAYSYTLTTLNNSGAVTFAATSSLPTGLSLSASGVLAGTPTASAGAYNINFSVTDGTSTVFRGLQLLIYAVDLTTSGALPNASQGVSYSSQLSASGGAGGYQYSLTGGGLPSGLSLSSGGLISGTTNAGTGLYWFYVTATDSAHSSYQKTMSIDVVGTPAQSRITFGPIDDPVVGNNYGWQISVCCGGTARHIHRLHSRARPDGR